MVCGVTVREFELVLRGLCGGWYGADVRGYGSSSLVALDARRHRGSGVAAAVCGAVMRRCRTVVCGAVAVSFVVYRTSSYQPSRHTASRTCGRRRRSDAQKVVR